MKHHEIKHLFFDDTGLEEIANLQRVMHKPAKKGSVIRPDWLSGELMVQTRSGPFWDPVDCRYVLNVLGQIYRSTDGLHWLKTDEAKVYDRNGTLVKKRYPHYVVYDPDDVQALGRYKALVDYPEGLRPAVSDDAVNFRLTDAPPIPSHDETNMSYDSIAKEFIVTARCADLVPDPTSVMNGYRGVRVEGVNGRAVYLYTSPDFLNWNKPGRLIFCSDKLDQEMGRQRIRDHLNNPLLQHLFYNIPEHYNVEVYNMGVFRYGDYYVGMPAMYHKTGQVKGDWPGFDNYGVSKESNLRRDGDWGGFHHIQLAYSKDLVNWGRAGNREPFIDLSPIDAGAGDEQCLIGPSHPVLMGDELWFYYTGLNNYGGYFALDSLDRDNGTICLAVLRKDGFVSLDAQDAEGHLITEPFDFTGEDLYLNAKTKNGSMKVCLCDEQGEILSKADVPATDSVSTRIFWEGDRARDLIGKKVKLKITARNTSIYSYWFSASSD